MSPQNGRRLGPWVLTEQLGQGGNAIVWRAHDASVPAREVALKVLQEPERSDVYRRFQREVEILRGLGDREGILPLLDASLPNEPSAEKRPWLAMPVATLLRDALRGRSVDEVVGAVRDVAATLASLADEAGIGHRDIKPANLFERDGVFLVGDFGLAQAPDSDEITRTGMRLGPVGYMPSELLSDPAGADPMAADVYSVGKTLWVLASDQRWPLFGLQPASQPGSRLSDLVDIPRVADLDQLIERTTQIDPVARPPMAQVARDLDAWLELSRASSPSPLELGALAGRMRAAFASQQREREVAQDREEQAFDLRDRLAAALDPIYQQLSELTSGAVTEGPDQLTQTYVGTHDDEVGREEILWREVNAMLAKSGPEHDEYTLRVGYCLELSESGDVLLGGLLTAGPDEYTGGKTRVISLRRSPLGSLAADQMVEQFVDDVRNALPAMVEAFLDQVEARQ